jgi:hypothetical protein
MSEPNLSNLHGLIIGVNKYKSPARDDLGGCVSDAKSIFSYFTDTLNVPQNQLLCLFDEQATRDGIIKAFHEHLICNKNIKPSDPIIVYFAGEPSSAGGCGWCRTDKVDRAWRIAASSTWMALERRTDGDDLATRRGHV